jgi:prophage regulatory protein
MTARILRLPDVKARTGLSRSTIYSRISDGTFVRPVRIGQRSVGWLESEIEAWIALQVAASRRFQGREDLRGRAYSRNAE